jgi:ABC-type Mn2+/Zn2+ transport system permease subunit
MKKKTKKSGYTRNRTAPQPDGCASTGTSILARKDWLVTLARLSVGIGVLLLFCLAGRGDYEHLTGVEINTVGEIDLMIITSLTAIVLGLVCLKTEGALDE